MSKAKELIPETKVEEKSAEQAPGISNKELVLQNVMKERMWTRNSLESYLNGMKVIGRLLNFPTISLDDCKEIYLRAEMAGKVAK